MKNLVIEKDVIKTIENDKKTNKQTNKQKRGFHGMLLSTLGASFLGILVAGKGTIRAGEGTIRPGQDF